MDAEELSFAKRDSKTYLASPPYFGHSHFDNRHLVKELCGFNGERVYDDKLKVWGTTSIANINQLVSSGLWFPVQIDEEYYQVLISEARNYQAMKIHEWNESEKKRLLEKKYNDEKLTDAALKAKKAQLLRGKDAKQIEREKKRKLDGDNEPKQVINAEHAALAAKIGVTLYEAGQMLKRGDVVPSREEIDETKRLGFTELAIAHGKTRLDFGPSMSLSPQGRLLRYCDFIAYETRCDCPLIYFDKEKLKPEIEKAKQSFADALNKEALLKQATG